MNEFQPLKQGAKVSGAKKSAAQKGFSLLEILVAFTILTFSLVVILRIFSSGINTAIIAEEYSAAVQVAESLMAQTGVVNRLQEGIEEGIERQKYSWLVDTRLYPAWLESQSQEASDEEDEGAILYQITVTVRWGDENNQGREVQLQTLRLASTPVP